MLSKLASLTFKARSLVLPRGFTRQYTWLLLMLNLGLTMMYWTGHGDAGVRENLDRMLPGAGIVYIYWLGASTAILFLLTYVMHRRPPWLLGVSVFPASLHSMIVIALASRSAVWTLGLYLGIMLGFIALALSMYVRWLNDGKKYGYETSDVDTLYGEMVEEFRRRVTQKTLEAHGEADNDGLRHHRDTGDRSAGGVGWGGLWIRAGG